MKNKFFINRLSRTINAKLILGLMLAISSCHKTDVAPQQLKNFKQINLVANKSEYNPKTIDPTLINGFGMAWSPTGIAWVNSVGGHVSEIYDAEGSIVRPSVNIPSRADNIGGLPTGIVFSGGKGFQIPDGPAVFLFSGFDGVISGWNSAAGSTAKRLRTPPNASYTGLTIAADGKNNFLYAANFGAGKIDVWDTAFTRVSMAFIDPSLPAGFSPYNIQAVGDLLFVLYSQIGSNGLPVAGKGKGFVSVFSPDGQFIHRFASEATLNVPWGITAVQKDFVQLDDLTSDASTVSGKSNLNPGFDDHIILIGNFGDGRINAFTVAGRFLGQLKSKDKPIEIDGLWALTFPPSTAGIDPRRLYFTAGPQHETDGLFGYLIRE
jgi:uncharacterized protein (TIGR03118 family)